MTRDHDGRMLLGQALAYYREHSTTASTVNRTLGFAGIGLIFTFRVQVADGRVPDGLVLPALLIVTSLALDFLQYVLASAIWGVFHRLKEKKHPPKEEVMVYAPAWLNWPALACFWTKLPVMMAAYAFLLRFLWRETF